MYKIYFLYRFLVKFRLSMAEMNAIYNRKIKPFDKIFECEKICNCTHKEVSHEQKGRCNLGSFLKELQNSVVSTNNDNKKDSTESIYFSSFHFLFFFFFFFSFFVVMFGCVQYVYPVCISISLPFNLFIFILSLFFSIIMFGVGGGEEEEREREIELSFFTSLYTIH